MNRKETDIFEDIDGIALEDARKTYSETVIDHYMNPRNLEPMEAPDGFTTMSGICGDTIGIYVHLDRDTIDRCTFLTNGCGPTIACGSAITCMVCGRTIEEARKLTCDEVISYLGGLPRENTHCADLAVNTLRGALARAGDRR